MKKIMFFAAVCLASVACSKKDNATEPVKPGLVTISATVNVPATKVQPDDPEAETVTFHWNEDDVVTLVNNNEIRRFYIIPESIEGSRASFSGEPFNGEMGDYRVEIPSRSEIEVSYLDNSFRPFAVGTGSGYSFTITAFFPVLKLNLTGDVLVGNIEHSYLQPSSSYWGPDSTYVMDVSLICADGIQLSDEASVVYLPLSDTSRNGFRLDIYDINGVPLKTQISKADLASQMNKIVDCPVLNVKSGPSYPGAEGLSSVCINGIWWAPVNCGCDAAHPLGLLYQWGRKYGQGYGDETPACTISATLPKTVAGGSSETNKDIFFKNTNGGSWADTTAADTDDWFTTYNPCPDGWRLPNNDELISLVGNENYGDVDFGACWDSGRGGYWFNGTSSPKKGKGLFLPAAGRREVKTGEATGRDDSRCCGYWTSSASSDVDASCLGIEYDLERYWGGYGSEDNCDRGRGLSVRCVQQ